MNASKILVNDRIQLHNGEHGDVQDVLTFSGEEFFDCLMDFGGRYLLREDQIGHNLSGRWRLEDQYRFKTGFPFSAIVDNVGASERA
jgi:hypothetical protein